MAERKMTLGVATSNAHKLSEITGCIADMGLDWDVISLAPLEEVDETGDTFEANARLKLDACLDAFNKSASDLMATPDFVIAEDAGVAIYALGGLDGLSPFPGIYSARWLTHARAEALLGPCPEPLTYTEKNNAILKLLETQPNRAAGYIACVALWVGQTGEILVETGTVDLVVAPQPSGPNGFGYDPIMIPADSTDGRTMAELSAVEKNRISHRRRALVAVMAKAQAALAAAASSHCPA